MARKTEEAAQIERKANFIKSLAKFLAGDQAKKGIMLDPRMEGSPGHSLAKEWAELRSWSPLFGYPTVDEAEKMLTKWLS
jgi:hypothetical protein